MLRHALMHHPYRHGDNRAHTALGGGLCIDGGLHEYLGYAAKYTKSHRLGDIKRHSSDVGIPVTIIFGGF